MPPEPAEVRRVYNDAVTNLQSDVEWSPADDPYAIAVSQSTWWRCAVQLSAGRLDDPKDPRAAPVSSTQIDARSLVFALVQLLAAERLEQEALLALGINAAVGALLRQARDRYLRALPGIQDMRNGLAHYDEWAMGRGRGPQKAGVAAGSEPRDVAAHYWGFGYHEGEGVVRFGPFSIDVVNAVPAACDLDRAIYAAAREADRLRPVRKPDH